MDRSRGTALITGGSRGIGRAIGERLAAGGWAVGLLARSAGALEEAASAIRETGGEARDFPADVLDVESLGRAVERFGDWSGRRLDALIVASGRFRGLGPIVAAEVADGWIDLETSVRGTVNALRAGWPLLRRSPAGSLTVLVGPGHNGELAQGALYGAAQAALVRLVESLAVELQPVGVAVFALNPGLVPTELMRHLLDSPEGRRWLPRFTEAFAEGKEVGPEVAAEMAAWLLDRRPWELSGRVVHAPVTPDLLETRLHRIVSEDRGRLRLR